MLPHWFVVICSTVTHHNEAGIMIIFCLSKALLSFPCPSFYHYLKSSNFERLDDHFLFVQGSLSLPMTFSHYLVSSTFEIFFFWLLKAVTLLHYTPLTACSLLAHRFRKLWFLPDLTKLLPISVWWCFQLTTVSKTAASTKNRSWWQSHPRVTILFSKNSSDIPMRQAAHFYLEIIYLSIRNTSINHPSLQGLGSCYTLRHQSSELSKQGIGTTGEEPVIIFSGGIFCYHFQYTQQKPPNPLLPLRGCACLVCTPYLA